MTHPKTENGWEELKEKIKSKWHDLTDAELDQVEGNLDNLNALLEEKYGMTKEEVKKHLDEMDV